MERLRQLNTCKVCDNITYDLEKGIVCRVTNDIAVFEKKCTNYSKSMEILTMETLKDYKKITTKKIFGSFLKKHVAPAISIVLLIATGYLMILWPEQFETAMVKKADGLVNLIMNIIWGIPTGVVLLGAGIYFLVVYVKRRKSYLL